MHPCKFKVFLQKYERYLLSYIQTKRNAANAKQIQKEITHVKMVFSAQIQYFQFVVSCKHVPWQVCYTTVFNIYHFNTCQVFECVFFNVEGPFLTFK